LNEYPEIDLNNAKQVALKFNIDFLKVKELSSDKRLLVKYIYEQTD